LNGYSYDTVRVFKLAGDNSFPQDRPLSGEGPSVYYFAKNYGLIKLYHEGFLLKDGSAYKESWNLIRKKIVQ
jgi:hypothetical protein